MENAEYIPKTPQQTFRKSPSQLSRFFRSEELWMELVDPSEVDSTPEEVEDHEEWQDREEEKTIGS